MCELQMIHTLSPSSTPGPRKDFALVRFALSKLALKTSFTPTLYEVYDIKSASLFLLRSVRDMTYDLYAPIRHMLYLTTHLENVLFGLNDVEFPINSKNFNMWSDLGLGVSSKN